MHIHNRFHKKPFSVVVMYAVQYRKDPGSTPGSFMVDFVDSDHEIT